MPESRRSMAARVGVIWYGMGNVTSLRYAFEAVGAQVVVATRPEELEDVTHVALPGVGAFGQGIENLRRLGFCDMLTTQVQRQGKPFLGVCLGMQLLASEGWEQGRHDGLGWIPGRVERLPGEPLRVPLIGWCEVTITRPDPLFEGLDAQPDFYFVHSYHFVPESSDVVISTSRYGIEFTAAIRRGNIWGTQFHPEKSHTAGLMLLKNFAASRAGVDG